mmetsp:Transcript_20747/g.52582  ORF Transcript_20747/g.52582 Transcript_20747/m.52582 type:complete len:376 (-) Transcript_20747:1828-2955(-)
MTDSKATSNGVAKKEDSDSSSSSSSSSDDSDAEMADKTAPIAKKKSAKSDSDSSSDSSSSSSSSDTSDDEQEDKKPVATKKAPAEDKKDSDDEDSSSSSDSSDSESEAEEAEPKTPKKEAAPVTPAKSASSAASNDVPQECAVQVIGYPYETTEDELRQFFKAASLTPKTVSFGEGDQKGRAIVYFETKEEVTAAEKLDGEYLGARWLKVREFKPRNGRALLERRGPGEFPPGCTTIFAGNLSFDIDEDSLREVFKDCGEITQIRWGMDRETEHFKGYGHVEFATEEACQAAAKLHGTYVMNRALRLDFAISRPRRDGNDGGDRRSFGGDRQSSGGDRRSFGGGDNKRKFNGGGTPGGYQKRAHVEPSGTHISFD